MYSFYPSKNLFYKIFVALFENDKNIIVIRKILIKLLSEDLTSIALLSQIIYHYLPSKGKDYPKNTVYKHGRLWIKKSINEWRQEVVGSPITLYRCFRKLKNLDLIEKQAFGKGKEKRLHISLNIEELVIQLFKKIDLTYFPELNKLIEELDFKLPEDDLKHFNLKGFNPYLIYAKKLNKISTFLLGYKTLNFYYTAKLKGILKPFKMKGFYIYNIYKYINDNKIIYKDKKKDIYKEEKKREESTLSHPPFPPSGFFQENLNSFPKEINKRPPTFANPPMKGESLAFVDLTESPKQDKKKKDTPYHRLVALREKYPMVILKGFEYKYSRLYNKVASNLFQGDFNKLDNFIERAIKAWDSLRKKPNYWFLKDKPQPRLTTILSSQFLEEVFLTKKKNKKIMVIR